MSTDEWDGMCTERPVASIRPHFVPFDATDRTHDVNLDGRHAHFEQAPAVRDSLGRQSA
jgi:hypothetical protein